MDSTVVTATTGRVLGSRPSRRLRAEGRLPGVVYGLGKEPVTVAVDYIELRDALKTDAAMNTVLQLDIDGSAETVIIRDVQRDPIKRVVTHADFLRVDPDQKVRVRIPIHAVGDTSTVLNAGGLIEQMLFEIEVECSPLAIPTEVEADLSIMTLERRFAVGDFVFPDGVTTSVPPEITVVSPVISRAAKVAAHEGEDGEAEGELDGDGDGDAGAEGDE